MGTLERNIDLNDLPKSAQEQLLEYYLFLKNKYSSKKKESQKKSAQQLPKDFYHPLLVNKYVKFDRTEIYNNG